ncbi:MAG: tRNA (cmo5U34)-methyltransferase [Lentisphaeria bacterium]|jgi:tRNA (cmo5U34)-methyltransferase
MKTGHNTPQTTDTLYSKPQIQTIDFVFDDKVVDVFPDMIERSVPGYSTIIHMIGQLAQRYVQKGTHCYDLGCSLGAATLSMRHRIQTEGASIIAVDNSPDMIKRCQTLIDADIGKTDVEMCLSDILDAPIHNASVCVLNFTLQFVPLSQRTRLLKKIYHGMVPGGILVVSEKLNFDDSHHSSLMTELHHYFKKTNGYSELEIAQKRNAIENVLVPETFNAHKQRLENIGFVGIETWFQCFNFASFIAFKEVDAK